MEDHGDFFAIARHRAGERFVFLNIEFLYGGAIEVAIHAAANQFDIGRGKRHGGRKSNGDFSIGGPGG